MTHTVGLSDLAGAQAIPVPHDDGITVRYDAARDVDGDPIVYAVIDSSDLCKLPTDILSSLGIGADRQDGQGDPVFFAGDDATLRLFVDTDTFPGFKADLLDAAEDHSITIHDAHGDLRALCGPEGDIVVPDMPAFVHAGHERISTDVALSILTEERRDLHLNIGKDDDGPGSQLC